MSDLLAIAIAHDGIAEASGQGREKFNQVLDMLLGYDTIPATLCFYAEGIRWLTDESPALDKLTRVCEHGARVIACRHCMTEAGLLGNMMLGELGTEDQVDHILRNATHAVVL